METIGADLSYVFCSLGSLYQCISTVKAS